MKNDNSFDSSNMKICTADNPKLTETSSSEATMCCSRCGARAHDPANLCSPMPLPASDPPV